MSRALPPLVCLMALWLGIPQIGFAQTETDPPDEPTAEDSPLFTLLLAVFDEDDSAALSEAELPRPLWRVLGAGDTDEDGGISAEEFTAFVDGLMQGCSKTDQTDQKTPRSRSGLHAVLPVALGVADRHADAERYCRKA